LNLVAYINSQSYIRAVKYSKKSRTPSKKIKINKKITKEIKNHKNNYEKNQKFK